ncbi:putative nucleosome remodeling complex ATPase subunit (Snf2h) [Aspergillus fischeri NRRL 181]|uniref:Nucleosome remodeling complex ATPase subunit (Snf2h), putative n=1 Tax=Neosartorya fischeri (strain ATCC 1020 / DSM 3700 / CBS 544.65 / FGSC A1164 / JCM 1740 / NRRL 181 / WB 181) TaxID=331117 RepID=A1DE72_NEOFI|nr:nucleosome remodeling complex ATPase subunit (Snf2h), putative [Aspergillus fischeri NRRL 181]EAW17679.1 nucleosome remodeling complex ATPase subunit (Snf2h), putative [Aspergillus fischeri NRRL 181]
MHFNMGNNVSRAPYTSRSSESGSLSSALSTPRSWSISPPTSPNYSEGSESIGENGAGETRCTADTGIHASLDRESFKKTERQGRSRVFGTPWSTEPHLNISASSRKQDILQDIRTRRITFLISHVEIILPLLGGAKSFEKLASRNSSAPGKIVEYESLGAQPRGLRAKLKPYQLEGLSFLVYLCRNGVGGILADEMGLGKTLQTLSFFQYLKERDGGHSNSNTPFLVVCPLSILETWLTEIEKWTPGLRAVKYHGSFEQRDNVKKMVSAQKKISIFKGPTDIVDIVITTYETLISEINWFSRVFVWRGVVLDEGHRIKNSRSKRSLVLNRIKAEMKLVLSGTPIQNDLSELWSIFHWLYPEIFVQDTEKLFQEAFSVSEGKFDPAFLECVRNFLRLIMIRRTKDSPGVGLDIPPKTETVLSVPLSPAQRSLYMRILTVNSMSEGSAETLGPGKYRITGNILMELRKCCIHPYLFADAIPSPYELGEHLINQSGKFLVLKKLLQHYVTTETKVIVFSNFDQCLNLCEDLVMMLQGSNRVFEYARLDGRTTGPWRKVMVHLFQNDPRYKVFLISIRAGGEGLNLTSSSVVVFLDEDWNPQVMRQAEARVHRIGQTRPVVIYKLRSTGTVEEQMSRRLVKKAYIADRVTENIPNCPGNDYLEMLKAEEVSMSQNSTDTFGLPSPIFVDQTFLSQKQIDTNEMSQWDMSTILDKCSSTQKDGGLSRCLTVEQEQLWLEKADRVRTNLFNGVTIDTSGRHHTVYAEEESSNLLRSNRRIGKERTVMIDGYAVSKESLRPSVEEPTSTNEECASPTNTFTHQIVSGDPNQGTAHANTSQTCFVCHQFNAEDCDICPRAFHPACLESVIEEEHPSSGSSICPHHYCWKCHKNASEAGRLLFCCRRCVRAFCDECFYWDTTTFVGANPAYEALGYFSKNAFYIDCLICRCDEKRKHASETEGYSGKRRKLVGGES